ncbi:DUF418 domain-containing protein [Pseudoalteromonas luteoviolacea]|uniref:DUF418 domain-containing protein n=1 Tax=Pseudoalteromonas luteoviolacea TaxID=43657 RepID=UPI001F304CBC|nr:DUF418 domain-containing protein [Pseudoalteromonas luteoviolacea]MCF6439658.1 DUF418 domain-containing protein [Pseudoalteromonas luteoviolacea]
MQRVNSIDFLRGIALLGLPLTNLMYMANFTSGAMAPSSTWSDNLLTYLVDVFAHGKFRTIFSILFGVSICLLYEKYGAKSTKIIKNRLLVLGFLGCIHGFLVWPGDILLNYAVSGLLVLAVIKLKSSTLIKLAICAIFIPIFTLILLILQSGDTSTEQGLINLNEIGFTALGLLQFNIENFFAMVALLPTITLWYIFGLMLIGVLIYRVYWMSKVHLSKFVCIFILIPLSIFGSLIARLSFAEQYRLVYELLNWLCAIPFSIALICLVLKYKPPFDTSMSLLSYVGRNSLSLYLLQSLVGVVLFQFAFPTWKIYFTQTDYFLLFIGFTILQLAVVWWFKCKSLRGPVEVVFAHCQNYLNRREY